MHLQDPHVMSIRIDLIVYKTLAGRPRDITDVEEIVRSQRAAGIVIDWKYVEDECAQWDALETLMHARGRAEK